MTVTAHTIIAFWSEAGRERWYAADPDFDALIRERFLAPHEAAARGDLPWGDSAVGALALLLLLDQFPRNMFRGTPRAFATDARALALASRAIARGFDRAHEAPLRSFFYVPFMHSEELMHQHRCEALYAADGDDDGLKWAVMHREIIERFGRFPHRNPILGRAMTAAEQAYLDADGFRG